MPKPLHPPPSLSKSALLLSPCKYWARGDVAWYEEKYTDTTDRDMGSQFHQEIDQWLRENKPAISKSTT